ncbi:MAG TPA: C-GCAxxG-C-C family protein [Oscillospiraceae bacterium]|nr:C-GCAxxG-C-C family protein [Oscillospiraceae bacterium]
MSEEMRNKCSDLAIENFKRGLNCPECVIDALFRAGVLEGVDESVRNMVIGFGGGMGLTGNVCGALSGAILANGAVWGRNPWDTPDEERGHEVAAKYYRRYNKLVHDFEAANGSVNCRDICKPWETWQEKGRRVNCMKLIGATAAMAYDLIQMDNETAFALPYGQNMGGNI